MKGTKAEREEKETNNLVLGTRLGSSFLNGSSLKKLTCSAGHTGDEVPSPLGWEDP